ncbi:carboxypeptidase-like regulatory domain-containing protein [Tunturiibacter lichenicola]|uniref:carboxypeptidase-like regulatory domain-containing protein n=1 Tax=Tunturiibacter lichenicola TaxID=2051959 RepID=UPI003D9BFD51
MIPPAVWETRRKAGSHSAKTHRTGPPKLYSCAIGSLLLILTCIPVAKAEDTCRGIRGAVTDSEGNPLHHAPLVITAQATDANFRTLTKIDGSYEFSRLPVGTYSLTLQIPGFQTTTVYGIKLDAGSSFFEKIEMLPGKMTSSTLVPADDHARSSCKHKSPAHIPEALAPR